MAKSKTKVIDPDQKAENSVLPLPDALARHHSEALAVPMREWVAQKRVPPVLLMTGVPGVGKREVGYYLAQWILCERSGLVDRSAASEGGDEPSMDFFGGGESAEAAAELAPVSTPAANADGDPAPCGECGACLRALHGTWVDFSEIRADSGDGEGSPSSKTLKVDQFREIKSTMGFGALQGTYKIILIPNADRMTPQAANSMLKLLEEPPKGWVFFLTASDPTLMLPTVLSRCQRLRLRPLTEADLDALLADAGVAPDKRRVCAKLAQGSWGRALQLAGDESWEKRKEIFHFFQAPAESFNPLVEWATSEPAHFDLFLDQLENLTADLVQWSVAAAASGAGHRWINSDGATALNAHAAKVVKHFGGDSALARGFWLGRAQRLAEIRQEALAPLNRKLLVQELLLPWVEAVR